MQNRQNNYRGEGGGKGLLLKVSVKLIGNAEKTKNVECRTENNVNKCIMYKKVAGPVQKRTNC